MWRANEISDFTIERLLALNQTDSHFGRGDLRVDARAGNIVRVGHGYGR
jgi:hypothetical protein